MLKLTQSQTEQLSLAKVPSEALEVFWRLFPELNFDVAVGGVVGLLEGKGQQRNARYSDEPVTPSGEFAEAGKTEDVVAPE